MWNNFLPEWLVLILSRHPLLSGHQLESQNFLPTFTAFNRNLCYADTDTNIKPFYCTKPAISRHFKVFLLGCRRQTQSQNDNGVVSYIEKWLNCAIASQKALCVCFVFDWLKNPFLVNWELFECQFLKWKLHVALIVNQALSVWTYWLEEFSIEYMKFHIFELQRMIWRYDWSSQLWAQLKQLWN